MTPWTLPIKTASDLKLAHEYFYSSSHFFTRKTMKFFGDTMRNYGVRKIQNGAFYELYRRHPVKHGLQNSAYFNAATFKRVINLPIEESLSV